MKTNIILTTAFLIFSLNTGFAKIQPQNSRAEKRIQLQKQIENIITSRSFVFVGRTALPMWGTAIDLTTNSNYLKFTPTHIDSYMPFFGQTYSAEYNYDPGVKFEGKPDEFQVKKLKKDRGYDVRVEVPLAKDTYDIFVHVSLDGHASLTISSYNRSSISYAGSIIVPPRPAQKENEVNGSVL